MPFTARSPTLALSAVRMSQVEVPITFTSVLGCAPAPTAPIWQSNAPPEMVTFCGRPRRFAHSSQSVPTGISAVKVSVNSGYVRFLLMIGSSSSKNAAGGRPPQLSCHSDLCPALQRPRRISCGRVVPESRAGTQSHSSIHDAAACATDASARVTCRILAQNHCWSKSRRCSGSSQFCPADGISG